MRYAEDNHLDFFIKLALLDCGGKDAKMFDEIDDSQVILSARLDRKIKGLIRRSQRSFAAERRRRVFVRIAVAAMLIMSLLFAALISITAVREAIWEALVEWHENYIVIKYKDPNKPAEDSGNDREDSGDEPEDSEQSTASAPTKIEDIKMPTYVVEGAVEDVFQSMIKVSVDYYLDDSFLYSFVQKILTDRNIYINNDGAITEELDINGELGTLVTYSDKSETILIWSDQEYVYSLYTTELDTETLVKIALSVKSVTSASPTTPTKIEEVRKPTYVIEGVIEDNFVNKTKVISDYFLNDELLYSFQQCPLIANENYLDNEGVIIETVDINGNAAALVEYAEKNEIFLLWDDKEYGYMLSTAWLDAETLIKIALSVK